MYCSNCGKEIQEGSSFCPFCGSKITGTEKNTADNIESKTESADTTGSSTAGSTQNTNQNTSNINSESNPDDFKRLVSAYISHDENGKIESNATRHYYVAFSKIKNQNQTVSMHWGAFWFGGWNLIYRKSFLYGFLFIGIPILFTLMMVVENGLTAFVDLAAWATCFMLADKIHYMRFATKLQEAERAYPNDISSQCKYLAHC